MSAAINAPTQLEKYELLEELGHGGMATVYRARDRRLGREVAIKILHRHLRDDIEVKERFYREAKAVAKLRHPGIVEVYDVSEPNDAERYLVVELVRGITLRQLLRERAPLPAELGLAIGISVAEALAHAHAQGVVHRDVKPENVLLELPSHVRTHRQSEVPSVTSDQPALMGSHPVVVKITDFGIAKVLDVQGVTSTGEVLGSPAHMAPEQIEGQAVGPQADIFSLGVMIYECVVGSLPFQGKNPAQVLRSVLDGEFTPTARARPEVGALIGQVIDRALARDPKDRFREAAEFGNAMQTEVDRAEIRQPLGQLSQYLLDPKQFKSAYEERLVTTLVAGAQQARHDGAIVLSSALYNRALALRPGDPNILADVARLTRSERRKTTFVRGAVLLGALGIALGAYRLAIGAKSHAVRASIRPATSGPARIVMPLAEPSGAVQLAPASSFAVASGSEPRQEAAHSPAVHSPNGNRVASRPTAAAPTGTRVVLVVLSGAAGSRLLIDGVEREWFGVKHELEYGVHRFQVVAPNDQCCIVPEPRSVKIGPGEGEIRVGLKVEFRDAQLQLSASEGTTLSCGELFPGILAAPGRRSVRVSKPETHGTCTLFPSAESGKLPRAIDVVLRAGGTFTVSGT
ncbi:MAG TPA: serine/threonine-protein kinase [Polyangiaceae bacterium]|nr:serine/threonine-protein kinase [Polyangiaceae bacterium]